MMKKITGFTLVELMVTLMVASILLAIGVPSFIDAIRRNRTISQANELVTALNLARSEAVKRGMQVSVSPSGDEWEDGWQVYVDEDGDGVLDAGDDTLLQEYTALSDGFTLRSTNFADWVAYLPTGISKGSINLPNGSFRLCTDEQDTTTGRNITINSVGRVWVEEGASSCP